MVLTFEVQSTSMKTDIAVTRTKLEYTFITHSYLVADRQSPDYCAIHVELLCLLIIYFLNCSRCEPIF